MKLFYFFQRSMLLATCLFGLASSAKPQVVEKPFHRAELIFPMEHWHNHASSIVECPNGDLLVCWFHGSGERQADDVKVEGARLRKGTSKWSPRFEMADTLGYPDTNCTMFIDPQGRLWLMWPTILANLWESALMKYRISADYQTAGAPRWSVNEVMHITPGQEFVNEVEKVTKQWEQERPESPEAPRETLQAYITRIRKLANDKLGRRLGWMTRSHPVVIDNKRLIVPLYSDGFSFSLMALSDDWGKTWQTSTPLIGGGNIQPSIARKKDGTLFTLMRDNGPAPKRLHMSTSTDNGLTWSPVTDSEFPNPGAGADLITLRNGHWALIYNDLEAGRHHLAITISDDEGKSWKWKRQLEQAAAGAGSFHYPALIQARDGSLHASYSYHLNDKTAEKDANGKPQHKTIKHAHFNEAWVQQGK